MKKSKSKDRVKILLIILLAISLGYALLATTLKINGTSTITKQTWNVYWDNAIVTEGSKTLTAPTIGEDQGDPVDTKLTWNVSLDEPGQFYEFTVDAVNAGSIDAKITDVTSKVNGGPTYLLPDFIKYEVTYVDGTTPAKDDILAKGTKSGNTFTPTTKKYKVRVEYDGDIATVDTINNMPQEGYQFDFEFEVSYYQPNFEPDGSISEGENFSTDSWEVIANAVRAGKYVYKVGDTKEIEMDINEDGTPETYTLRVANASTPAACKNENFSQTACGFVLEFADILELKEMNQDESSTEKGSATYGSWEYSYMRTYLNDTIYNKLPSALKNELANTKVVTGHNYDESSNYVTTDKLYLLSTHEIWKAVDNEPNGGIDYCDTAYNQTRQLDYYAKLSLATNSGWGDIIDQAAATKTYYSSVYDETYPMGWWTRTPIYRTVTDYTQEETIELKFYYAESDWPASTGDTKNSYTDSTTLNATSTLGVSPAFKLN